MYIDNLREFETNFFFTNELKFIVFTITIYSPKSFKLCTIMADFNYPRDRSNKTETNHL